jgi:hypothetical protein
MKMTLFQGICTTIASFYPLGCNQKHLHFGAGMAKQDLEGLLHGWARGVDAWGEGAAVTTLLHLRRITLVSTQCICQRAFILKRVERYYSLATS